MMNASEMRPIEVSALRTNAWSVQRPEGFQHLDGAGKDRDIDEPVLITFAAREQPPRHQNQTNENAGQQKFPGARELFANAETGQAHDHREQPNKQQRNKEEAEHYSFSSGKTLTSTRRFFLLCSTLLASVIPGAGLSQPLPMTLNLFGSNLYLLRSALRTESARS